MTEPEHIKKAQKVLEEKYKAKEEKIKYNANFPGLCELVKKGDEVYYLMTDGSLLPQINIEGETFKPPAENLLDFLIPNADDVLSEAIKHEAISDDTDDTDHHFRGGCTTCSELYNDLVNYHKRISELPNPLHYDLLALHDFHTYFIEKFNFSPIIYFFADRERGKTRTAKGMIFVSRRGVMTETLRESNLIRWSRNMSASLLFDVKDIAKKISASASEDLIYGRAERGVIASRVLFPEKGPFQDTVRFEVFGPTIVTSNRMLDDIGLSRTIMIEMRPSSQIFTEEPVKESGLKYITKLTAARLAHSNTKFIRVKKSETGRLEDLLIGFLSMIRTLFPNKEKTYWNIKTVIKNQKKEISGESMEAQILQIILNNERAVEEGSMVLTYDHISNLYNEGKRENLQFDSRTLGRITKAMGFESKRNSAGTLRGIVYNPELIEKLKIIYGLDETEESEGVPHKLSSVSSETSELASDKKDQVDIAEDIFKTGGPNG